MNKLKLLSFLILTVIFLSSFNIAWSQLEKAKSDEKIIEVKYESVNPNPNYVYSFKRLKEKLTLFLLSSFPQKQADYYKKILKIRLAEYKYVVDKKDISNLQTSSERYFTTAGELTDLIVNKKVNNQKEDVKKLLMDQQRVVRKLMEVYNDTTAEWRFVKHTSDYLDTYISKL